MLFSRIAFWDSTSHAQTHGTKHIAVSFGGSEDDGARWDHLEIHFLKNGQSVPARYGVVTVIMMSTSELS